VRAPLQLPESLEMQELPGESAVVVSPH